MSTITVETGASSRRTSGEYWALRSAGAVYVVAWVIGLLRPPHRVRRTQPQRCRHFSRITIRRR